jgi:hypothetical protein
MLIAGLLAGLAGGAAGASIAADRRARAIPADPARALSGPG